MASERAGNYLRSHRRKSGMSQRELALIAGFDTAYPVSRHERSATLPALMVALSYEIIFRAPIHELFPGLYRSVEARIEERLAEMEEELQQSTTKGRKAAFIARKLEWLNERREREMLDLSLFNS
jgi:DNA-binding XRE family transcriptional regulator